MDIPVVRALQDHLLCGLPLRRIGLRLGHTCVGGSGSRFGRGVSKLDLLVQPVCRIDTHAHALPVDRSPACRCLSARVFISIPHYSSFKVSCLDAFSDHFKYQCTFSITEFCIAICVYFPYNPVKLGLKSPPCPTIFPHLPAGWSPEQFHRRQPLPQAPRPAHLNATQQYHQIPPQESPAYSPFHY